MKQFYVILFLSLLASPILMAQPKPKQKTPAKKETQDVMNEAQRMMEEAMKKMSPEDRKMMESRGIKMPDLNKTNVPNNVPVISNQQMADFWEKLNNPVPKKDVARITAIKPTVSNAGMGAYTSSIHSKVANVLLPMPKSFSEKLYAKLHADGVTSTVMGNTGVSLFIIGRVQPAIYIMGKACVEDPSNTDNLNNYASMLSMMGGEQLAIPILNNLNIRYPGNSTILNNLGQAWFGLGDITKAEKYLDSTIRLFANHPQANFTKALILEKRGNKQAAIEALKRAIKDSYSAIKEDKLLQLGYELTSKDISLPPNKKNDLLNLGAFNHPPFPKSVDESIALEPVWEKFMKETDNQIASLKAQADAAGKEAEKEMQEKQQAVMDLQRKVMATGSAVDQSQLLPSIYATRAALYLKGVQEDYDRKMKAFVDKQISAWNEKYPPIYETYNKTIEALQKQAEASGGVDGEGSIGINCPQAKEAANKFLRAYNEIFEQLQKEYIDIRKRYINDLAYGSMYTQWPAMYEVT